MRSVREIDGILSGYMDSYMEKNSLTGISIGMVLNGELAYTRAFGISDMEKGARVTETSMFHSASISKTFVAMAVMQLQERGLLELDKPVSEYLPYFRLKDERYRNMTIRLMLSHTSGMPDVYDYEWDKPKYHEGALEEYVRSLYDNELLWEPGERFAYSNIAYEVLGDVIAKISGTPFENYMKENIFKLLGMNNTGYLIKEVPQEELTAPHVIDINAGYEPKKNEYYPYNRIHAPSSTLWSNPSEMCRYAIANLNRGSFNGIRLLKPESYEAMWCPAAETGWGTAKVGYSWFMREYKGIDLIYHTGGDTGYCSNLVLIPEKASALSLFCNCDNMNLSMVTDYILDVMLGFEVQPIKNSIIPELARLVHDKGTEVAGAWFEDIRNSCRDEYYISDVELNRLAYRYKLSGKVEEAIAVIETAVKEFSKAANLYDSLGEFYLEKEDRQKAIECYRKSIELDPNNSSSISALKNMGVKI